MLSKFSSLVFDCDGVVLNSNKVKTQAFYEVAKVYGHEPAQALKIHHMQNGGISRYKKFEYLFTNILNKAIQQTELDSLLMHFAEEVKSSLLTCEVAEGLEALRKKTKHAKWFIVSGGDQNELRKVFSERGLNKYFDGGIFGSPDTKEMILKREEDNLNIIRPGLFIGDSKYDHQAASQAGLDFVFITQWTEVKDWNSWSIKEGIKVNQNLFELADL